MASLPCAAGFLAANRMHTAQSEAVSFQQYFP